MRVQSVERLCIAAGRCAAVAEDLFELDDDGFVRDAVIAVPPEREDAALQATVLCPGRALTVLED